MYLKSTKLNTKFILTDTPLSNNNHNLILGDFNYHVDSNILPHSTFKNVTDSIYLYITL